MTIEEKILKYTISKELRLFDVLKKMDLEKSKSLIVIENSGVFIGLISIGDIQRAIIKNLPLDIKVGEVLRNNIIIGSDADPFQLLKDKMVNLRIEMMPIVDKNNLLFNILLWDEIFDYNIGLEEFDSDIPVVIMAGGLGSRLRPLTNIIPKPLLPIGENSIIDVIICFLLGSALAIPLSAKLLDSVPPDVKITSDDSAPIKLAILFLDSSSNFFAFLPN
jgi:CBS domain-containing protein